MGPNRFYSNSIRFEFLNLELDRAEFQASNIEPNRNEGDRTKLSKTRTKTQVFELELTLDPCLVQFSVFSHRLVRSLCWRGFAPPCATPAPPDLSWWRKFCVLAPVLRHFRAFQIGVVLVGQLVVIHIHGVSGLGGSQYIRV